MAIVTGKISVLGLELSILGMQMLFIVHPNLTVLSVMVFWLYQEVQGKLATKGG
jgi:hypothetical protein